MMFFLSFLFFSVPSFPLHCFNVLDVSAWHSLLIPYNFIFHIPKPSHLEDLSYLDLLQNMCDEIVNPGKGEDWPVTGMKWGKNAVLGRGVMPLGVTVSGLELWPLCLTAESLWWIPAFNYVLFKLTPHHWQRHIVMAESIEIIPLCEAVNMCSCFQVTLTLKDTISQHCSTHWHCSLSYQRMQYVLYVLMCWCYTSSWPCHEPLQ